MAGTLDSSRKLEFVLEGGIIAHVLSHLVISLLRALHELMLTAYR